MAWKTRRLWPLDLLVETDGFVMLCLLLLCFTKFLHKVAKILEIYLRYIYVQVRQKGMAGTTFALGYY